MTKANDNSKPPLTDVLVGRVIDAGITAFVVGGVLALSEGHGELPGDFYSQPRPVGQLTMMAQTTTGSTGLFLKNM